MDEKKAAEIAAALAPTETTSSRLARAAMMASPVAARFRTGMVTLAGAYLGWRLVVAFPEWSVPPELGAIAVGLIAAAVVPTGGPNNSFKGMPLRGTP